MTIQISIEDNGREIELEVGDVLRIELPENPTTGFRWLMTMPAAGFLEPTGDSFLTTTSTPGAGGRRCLEFRAKAQGKFELTLVLRREWEGPSRKVETFRLVGRVTPVPGDGRSS